MKELNWRHQDTKSRNSKISYCSNQNARLRELKLSNQTSRCMNITNTTPQMNNHKLPSKASTQQSWFLIIRTFTHRRDNVLERRPSILCLWIARPFIAPVNLINNITQSIDGPSTIRSHPPKLRKSKSTSARTLQTPGYRLEQHQYFISHARHHSSSPTTTMPSLHLHKFLSALTRPTSMWFLIEMPGVHQLVAIAVAVFVSRGTP